MYNVYSQSIQWKQLIQLFINDSVAELENWQCCLENEMQKTIVTCDYGFLHVILYKTLGCFKMTKNIKRKKYLCMYF